MKQVKCKIFSLLLAVILAAAVIIPARAAEFEGVQRIYGADRYQTAYQVADALKAQLGIEKFDTVVIASGKNFPDALTGSYLAIENNAPILMTKGNDADALKTYLGKNLKPGGNIYILGGTKAVPASLENALSGYDITRLQGANRYATNLQILRQVDKSTVPGVLVCDGRTFADSLSASATDMPILLVNGGASSLTAEQVDYLKSITASNIYIIGGEKAINAKLEAELSGYGKTVRIGGATRIETSQMVAQTFCSKAEAAVLAYSLKFPDGLCGGPLAHALGGPVLLSKLGAESGAKAYIQEKGIQRGIVLGGDGLIPDRSVRKAFQLSDQTAINVWPQKEFGINYVLNGGINSDNNPTSYISGNKTALQPATRQDYAFGGWYLDKACTKKLESITAETTGDLTLYARWYLEPLNISGSGMDNMIWSWWYYPQVVQQNDDVFWGYTTNDGYCGVAHYDGATDTTQKTILKKASAIDDHNGLALTTMDDGRILCVYSGGHNSDNDIHIRISNQPGSVAAFDTHVVLKSSGKTCYGQILKYQGRYYVFYRINNNSWGYRSSADCLTWTEETVLVKSTLQYYCRFVPTTQPGLIRVCMTSNPTADDPQIRMGFLDLNTGKIYNADGRTELGMEKVAHDQFTVLITPPQGKIQRMFDVAVTAPEQVRILYTVFSKAAGSDDSIYYLYDTGTSYEVCPGGKPLWDPKYQLGAAFVDADTIVAGRNSVGTDYMELYEYDGFRVTRSKVIDSEMASQGRNGRPIVDVNGKAILWHNGYYNPQSYKDFDTDARLYLMDQDRLVKGTSSGQDLMAMGEVKPENVEKVEAFAQKLYEENRNVDPASGKYTWQLVEESRSWIYFTGLVHQGFLSIDMDQYYDEVREFYTLHVREDGSIHNYANGTLDAILPAINIISLLETDKLTDQERTKYEKALNYIYHEIENQVSFPNAGNLLMHAQDANGQPVAGWQTWSVCLDGVYMSQLYLIRLAELIDDGGVTITDKNGAIVTSKQIWDDVYERISFVMNNMTDSKTGLVYHGYNPAEGKTNGVFWSRGLGWFAMLLTEAAEKVPDNARREVMTQYFQKLMSSVVQWQDPQTLLWYNVINKDESVVLNKDGVEIHNQPESSGSAMFVYCLLRGYHNGLLPDAEYRAAGLRGFNALVQTKLTQSGLTDICLKSAVHTSPNMYQAFGYVSNEGKAIGPLLMALEYVSPADPTGTIEENVQAVRAYANALYRENTNEDYVNADFTWDNATRDSNWIYYTGMMMDAFLETDFDAYHPEVRAFYDQHISADGTIPKYLNGELDAAVLGVGMVKLLRSDVLTVQEKQSYSKAINYIYNQLEKQKVYPQAGNLLQHSQKSDGTPRDAWTKWNICLDGVYMSQMFLIEAARAVDDGILQLKSTGGAMVSTKTLWDDIYSRLDFVMHNLTDSRTGLLNHGYSVGLAQTNNAVWSRGIGWFAMVLLEGAENHPDSAKASDLRTHFTQLMTAVCNWQDPNTSLWYNVTDGKGEYAYTDGKTVIPNKPETSGSAMIAYSLLKGWKTGILKDKAFRDTGMRAFNALVQTKLTGAGLVDIYSSSSVTPNKNMYQVNGYTASDGKGIGPLILAAKYAC